MKKSITQERIKHLFSYNENTGEFIRKVGVKGSQANTKAGTFHRPSGYIHIGVDGKKYRSHRLAWFYVYGKWPNEIDHINGDRSDNSLSNLRECSRTQNNVNCKTRSDNSSGHKGVSWVSRISKWRAYLTDNNKQIHLGYFSNMIEAIKVRESAALTLYGEYIRQ